MTKLLVTTFWHGISKKPATCHFLNVRVKRNIRIALFSNSVCGASLFGCLLQL